MAATVISDKYRAMMSATRQADGRILVRAGNRFLLLTDSEVERLSAFSRGQGVLQTFPAR
ncbi:hypothetical protein [Mycolicibacterium pallens]|uniref:Uncharacterized protein n=1 Tax=Mycolicibacterium pallens TaxID=370524 RepID=A0ABX8VFL9_9MYCO|nr:hypothetical protein [Mycolicibacterium pallens]QYL14570.1 hypothetical protein K0O64_15250 [Mycolicibacterium pallens]